MHLFHIVSRNHVGSVLEAVILNCHTMRSIHLVIKKTERDNAGRTILYEDVVPAPGLEVFVEVHAGDRELFLIGVRYHPTVEVN